MVGTYSQNFSTLAQLESIQNKQNKFKNEISGLLILAHALGVSRPCILEAYAFTQTTHNIYFFSMFQLLPQQQILYFPVIQISTLTKTTRQFFLRFHLLPKATRTFFLIRFQRIMANTSRNSSDFLRFHLLPKATHQCLPSDFSTHPAHHV